MINKYAEIQDRIILYNACKGILRVKQAMIATPGSTGSNSARMPAGAISSMNPAHSQSFQQQPQAFGQAQKPLTYEQFTMANPGLSTKDNRSFLHKAVTALGGPATANMGRNSDLTNAYADYQKQFYQNQLKQQGYQPQGQQQPMQQQAPQGVDPNQWQQFQRWQQMMQQFPAPQDDKMQKIQKQWENIQKNPLGTGLGMV